MTWQACARSGDATCALLQPHQVLISQKDAVIHSIKQLDLVYVNLKPLQSTVLVLECVIDRHQTFEFSVILSSGRIQLHPWIFDVCSVSENATFTLDKAELAPHASVWVSLLAKYPHVVMSGSDSVRLGLGGSCFDLLPESVQQKQIDLEAVLRRQLLAAGTLRAAQVGQLVPVTLLGDTYVFMIDKVENNDKASKESMRVFVTGWSDGTNTKEQIDLTEQVALLSVEEGVSRKSGASYERELDDRLWQIGFVGYTTFVQDVLLNIALVLNRGQKSGVNDVAMEQIGSHGVLLSGVSGVGKSLAMVALHHELDREKIRTWRTDGMSLLMAAESSVFSSAFEYLAFNLNQHFPGLDLFNDCATVSPSCVGVMLIDELDMLLQLVDGQIDSNAQLPQLGSALLRLIDELSLRNSSLVVVGATTIADTDLPAAAKRAGRFSKVLNLIVPTEQSRRQILRRHLIGLPLRHQGESTNDDFADSLALRLSKLTGGYVAKDLVRICRNAAAQAYTESVNDGGSTKPSVEWTQLLQAQQQVKPSQLREFNVESPSAQGGGMLAFAGYAAIQKQLIDFVSCVFHPTATMGRLGISNASGILLSGPSGCGKTLLVQTLAAQAQVNFVSIKSSELISKYFGDSEKAVRQLFARARAAAPCLLFFDEFDSIAHKRSFGKGDGRSSGCGVYARVLSTFLNEMDGVGSQRVSTLSASQSNGASSTKSNQILVVAATNRKDALDAALVRPGRIDKNVELGYPRQQDIQDILAFYARKIPLANDVDIQALAARPRGYRV